MLTAESFAQKYPIYGRLLFNMFFNEISCYTLQIHRDGVPYNRLKIRTDDSCC